jgi:hypothetical protein
MIFLKLIIQWHLLTEGMIIKQQKSDTENILKYINKPGKVFWHVYDVRNEVGEYLQEISVEYDIKRIKNTRLCYFCIN